MKKHCKRILICLLATTLLCCPAFAAIKGSSTPRNARFGFNSLLLGAFIDHKWVAAEELQTNTLYRSQRIWGGHPCKIYGANGFEGNGIMGAILSEHPDGMPQDQQWPGELFFDVHLEQGGILPADSARLVIDCDWDASPRQAQALPTSNPGYEAIIENFLAKQGLPGSKARIMQLFRVDLEGDGVDEVVICAQNILAKSEAPQWLPNSPLAAGLDFPTRANDGTYSLILLRKIVNGQVRDIPLAQFITLKDGDQPDAEWTPSRVHKVYQFADLNGDGVLEIIAGQDYYEGFMYQVYAVEGGSTRLVLENGIGL